MSWRPHRRRLRAPLILRRAQDEGRRKGLTLSLSRGGAGRHFVAAFVVAFLLIGIPSVALAAVDKPLDDPALETRALALQQEIRCLVCQGQSIADSNADLAYDLRMLVRERIAAGDSDAAVLDYLHARYGDFVLLQPPVKPATYALWFGPPLLLVIGGVAVFFFLRRTRRRGEAAPQRPLSEDEKRALDALMRDDPR